MTGSSWLSRSGSDAWPIICSDSTSRPMPTRMRPNWRQSRRSVAMNITVPATRQIGTSRLRSKVSSLTTSAEPISAPRTASWPAMPLTMPAPAKEPTSSVTAVELCKAIGKRRAGQHRHDRIAHGGAQPVAQHVAIGALDAGAHHAGGKQHQRDRAGQMQQDDRAAHWPALPATGDGARAMLRREEMVSVCESRTWRCPI